jgi:anti-sigma factor RsiW
MSALKCDDVQRGVLEAFDEHGGAAHEAAVVAHLQRCPQCAQVVAEQRELDATLTAALVPPRLSPSFRAALYRRLDAPAPTSQGDALPDILHLASCAIFTAVSAVIVPEYGPVIVAGGTLATVMTHLLLSVMRNTLDESAL